MMRLSSMWITRRYWARGRDVDLEQRLDRAAEGHRVEVVGEVVHPLDDRDDLPVGLVLGGLFDAGVDVADDRLDVAHDLALERDQQAQHPVRRGVVGAHVERQQLVRGFVGPLGGDGLDLFLERDALLAAAVLGERRLLGRAHRGAPGERLGAAGWLSAAIRLGATTRLIAALPARGCRCR